MTTARQNTARAAIDAAMSERAFMAQVVELAEATGWMVYHTHDSRRSNPGFPDLVCLRSGRALFAELKREHGRISDAQIAWIAGLKMAGLETYLWRPRDWDAIVATLTAPQRAQNSEAA